METLQLSASIKKILESAPGENLERKIFNLVLSDLERRLHLCAERILEFEKKYGMSFPDFEQAWRRGEIAEKHSHEVERDYMEWESLVDEHQVVLAQLRKIKEEMRTRS